MVKTMTNEQFDAYLERTGNGISSENGNVAFVSDRKGNVVAMFWRGAKSYLETLEEPIKEEKDVLNPRTWSREQWKDAIISMVGTVVIFVLMYSIIYIFH